MMSRWQHFLHALGIHDWHETVRFTASVLVQGHGPHNPEKSREYTMVTKVCCHCGAESTRTEQEWLGF